MDDKIQEFIDKYVDIAYLDKNWINVYDTPSFVVTANRKVQLLMPDGEPLSENTTVRI